MKRTFSINALSVELGIDRRTLARRLADVPPVEVRGRSKRWRMQDVVRSLEPAVLYHDRNDYERERARLTRARASLAELEERERLGELVPVGQIERFISTLFMRVKQGVLTLPSRAAPKAHDAKTIPEVERILLGYAKEVLQEISETKVHFTVIDAPRRSPVPITAEEKG